ncbi:MAG: hypothetical protein KAH07_05810 [Flavobacteriaceae bacterium]|nr:hypothetical protein [Flavobacteriaceae bacterium]
MNKVGKIFEMGYLVVAGLFGYTAFEERAEEGWWTYLILMVLAVFMFFFRRNFRKKREDRLNQN